MIDAHAQTRATFALLLCAALPFGLGCGDGLIGRDCPPSAPECISDAQTEVLERFRTDFPQFPSHPRGEFRVVWSIDNGCVDACASEGMLLPAPGDAAWSVPREPFPGQLVKIDSAQQLTPLALAPPTATSAPPSWLTHHVTSDAQGGVIAHLQWDVMRSGGVRAPGPDEIQVVQPSGALTRVQLDVGSEFRLPLGAIGASRGYFLFARAGNQSDARLFGRDGKQIWRSADIPRSAARSGGAALALSASYALSAGEEASAKASRGVLWLDAKGDLLRFATPEPASWRSFRFLPAGDGDAFVVAAQSDVVTPFSNDGFGNIDIAQFAGTEVRGGVRLMRVCYHEMLLRGFAREPGGTLFVSTVAGSLDEPRGLVCRIPLGGEPRCYQAPEAGLMVGEIVATSPTMLFAISGDRILRIELPE